jgi:hypothetical protein
MYYKLQVKISNAAIEEVAREAGSFNIFYRFGKS